METNQATSPEKDNSAVAEAAAKDVVPTDEDKGTSSLTKGAAQELPHAWMSGLTAEQKADADLVKSLSKFEKGIPDLARSYAELEKKQGQAVAIPNEKATPEERARYLKAIGVPDKAEGYKLGEVQLPKGIVPDEVMAKAFLETAHKAGLTAEQVKAVYGWYMPAFAKQLTEAGRLVKLTSEQAEAKLREELGADFDAAQTYKERAFRTFFDEEAAGLFVKSGLGNSPSVLKGFIKLGKSISEHVFADGSRGAAMETGTFGKRTDEQLANALYDKKGT
jgi:hypothetical protein